MLLERLDSDEEEAGRKLMDLRHKLANLFEKRGCYSSESDELVDEVIDRVSLKLEQGEEIENIVKYPFGVCKFVLLEHYKKLEKSHKIIEINPDDEEVARKINEDLHGDVYDSDEEKKIKLDCLYSCIESICRSDEEFEMFLAYEGDGASDDESDKDIRGRLARKLGITLNTLGTRIARLRIPIFDCTRKCVAKHL